MVESVPPGFHLSEADMMELRQGERMEVLKQMEAKHQENVTRRYEFLLQEFFKNWAPDDPVERDLFDRDLIVIIRQVYTDAQRPLIDQLTTILSRSSLPSNIQYPNIVVDPSK